MSEWKEYRLAEVCEKIGSGSTPRGGAEAYLDFGEYKLIRSQNVLDFNFTMKGLAYINEMQAFKLKNVEVKERDVLLNITGDSVARVCQVPKSVLPARVNQHVAILRPIVGKISNEYLKYYLLEPSVKDYLLMLSSSGGTRNAITKNMLEELLIKAPDLPTQTAIAEILSSLDDKIELNNKINQELENLAQTLFKQWFIDFEFPNENGEPYKSSGGEMVDSELGEIPKGWEVGTLSNILDVKGGSTPSTVEQGFWNGNIHWSSPKDLSNLKSPLLIDTEKRITELGLSKISSGLLPKGTLLLSSRAPIGYLAITEIETAINQGYIAINGKKGYSNLYLLNWLKFNMNLLLERANGSTFLEISKTNFKQIKCTIPPLSVLDVYSSDIEHLFGLLRNNILENLQLTNLRDTLLPKLISGELEVSQTPTI